MAGLDRKPTWKPAAGAGGVVDGGGGGGVDAGGAGAGGAGAGGVVGGGPGDGTGAQGSGARDTPAGSSGGLRGHGIPWDAGFGDEGPLDDGPVPGGFDSCDPAGKGPAARGPRWIVPARALVVVLAMAVAVTAVLWLEQAGVAGSSAGFTSRNPAKVAVPAISGGAGQAGALGTHSSEAPATGPPGSAQTGSTSAGSAPVGSPSGIDGGAGHVVVHVVGAVRKPGVVSISAGSRIYQAVDAAGGALPSAQLSALNLAALVADGTQIMVPTVEQAAAGMGGVSPPDSGAASGSGTGAGRGAGSGGAGKGGAAGNGGGAAGNPVGGGSGLVNLNTATAAELDTLPGVGPVLAGRIVQWRTDHGSFKSIEELDAIPGIGPKMLATLRPLVSVG